MEYETQYQEETVYLDDEIIQDLKSGKLRFEDLGCEYFIIEKLEFERERYSS